MYCVVYVIGARIRNRNRISIRFTYRPVGFVGVEIRIYIYLPL